MSTTDQSTYELLEHTPRPSGVACGEASEPALMLYCQIILQRVALFCRQLPSLFGGYPIANVSLGWTYTMILTTAGVLYIAGNNAYGQLAQDPVPAMFHW